LNPAVVFGTELVTSIIEGDFKFIARFYIYFIGEILGSVLAALFY
jgi:glycerol uptake facilitator-like aquaporin